MSDETENDKKYSEQSQQDESFVAPKRVNMDGVAKGAAIGGDPGDPPLRVAGTPEASNIRVGLQRTAIERTDDQALWVLIRYTTNAMGFDAYAQFMDSVLSGTLASSATASKVKNFQDPRGQIDPRRFNLPFPGVDGYALLKTATEVFLMASVGIDRPFAWMNGDTQPQAFGFEDPFLVAQDDPEAHLRLNERLSYRNLINSWGRYRGESRADTEARLDNARANIDQRFAQVIGIDPNAPFVPTGAQALPYLDVIRRKLGVPVVGKPGYAPDMHKLGNDAYGILEDKLRFPTMVELICSYWHEEGMLVQTMNALSMRFQNRRGAGDRDPLANLEIDPLRPLTSFLWGFVQDEQHRLSVARRAYEYDHHYGFSLHGKAIPPLRTADSRTRFLEAFHNLLFQCVKFYNEDDDTTRIADAFPVLNSLKEVHMLLTEGGHNQYGDLPWTARQEMLMMQWILARPEMREFIGGRPMVAYPEPWMDRVDTMKTLQSWSSTNIMHFRDLGVFGEQTLLAIRFGNWNVVIQPQQAANWARYWRAEIQGYIHAYRAVTGVDLTAIPTDNRISHERFLPPSYHLRARLAEQARARR